MTIPIDYESLRIIWWLFLGVLLIGFAIMDGFDLGVAMLLPYVAPTTDWIRLQRRFPVTIYLDEPPPDGELFMGADARTVIFPH